jgi:GNAT superfamily N-acetyltransferase
MIQTRSSHPPHTPPALMEHLRDGTTVRIRPLLPADVSREQAFLSRLTAEALSYRFLGLIKDRGADTARELTQVDTSREFVLVALVGDEPQAREIGAACYRLHDDATRCDCAVTVDPAWQHQGVGRLLMHHLIGVARAQGVRWMYAVDAVRCAGAHALAERLGFHSRPDPEDPAVVTFELELT